jgi:hypothetical protein
MNNIPSIPTEILHKLINLGGLEKTMRCDWCNEYTKHISTTHVDTLGNNSPLGFKAISTLLDFLPMVGFIFGNPFVCLKCGKMKHRGGLFSIIVN